MDDDELTRTGNGWNASVIALVIFLAGMLYFFGESFSGEPTRLTVSMSQATAIQQDRH